MKCKHCVHYRYNRHEAKQALCIHPLINDYIAINADVCGYIDFWDISLSATYQQFTNENANDLGDFLENKEGKR